MATYTNPIGFEQGTPCYPDTGLHVVTKMQLTLDFAAIIAARVAAGATALAAADVIEVLPIPAGSVILSAGIDVVSAESTATTATFTVSGGGVTYASAVASNATGMTAANLANPTLVTADDTLDITLGMAAPTDAVVRVWAIVADCN